MKKLLIYIGLTACLSACDFLETDTYDELSENNVYNNLERCEAGLAGIFPYTTLFRSAKRDWQESTTR